MGLVAGAHSSPKIHSLVEQDAPDVMGIQTGTSNILHPVNRGSVSMVLAFRT